MRCTAVVLGIALLAATVSAQSNFDVSRLPAAPAPAGVAPSQLDPASSPPLLFADASPSSASAAPLSFAASSDPASAQGAPPLTVRNLFPWELYAGYTFFHFYEVPNLTNVENGFDISATYFPHNGWIGFDGAMTGTFGSQAGCISKFTLVSGGARVRWAGPEGTRLWLHGTVGQAHFFPQTAYGGQNALAYQVGGGIDVTRGYRRIGYRFEVDAVGSRFFQSYQISPKFSAGVVFHF